MTQSPGAEQHGQQDGNPGAPLADAVHTRPLAERKTVFSGRIWDVVSDTFSLTDGGPTMVRDYVDHTGAVAIIPVDEKGRILLLKQYRHPVGMDLWEVPAGLLDVEDEPPLDAAARELAEEADLRAAEWHVLVDFFNSPGGSSEALRVFVATGLSPVPEQERHVRTDEESEFEYAWVSLDEAVSAILAGDIHNVSTVVGVLALQAAVSRSGGELTGDALRRAGLRPAEASWTAHPHFR
ncbi:NUDIX domain-containing protein [Arthrobacter woluwensis]|uniref:NUDIX domain-containing protein n=1 Tax=Arthrobacter woluwensis TaxID=156980 RepID=UPI001AFA5C1C|nr:NUDIX hydrolase [Arthrobacter woluwensis]QTF71109.1 NUDIX hydrolase [Arthrobacter woluwensis]